MSKMTRASLLALIGWISVYAAEPTRLCGILSMPTSLTRVKSPYLITGDLYIPAASRLTIESGVEVLISSADTCRQVEQQDRTDSQFVSIKVHGALFIHGSPEHPVVIRPANSAPRRILWDGIRLYRVKENTSDIRFLHISGAQKGLQFHQSTTNVRHSLFDGNNIGIWIDQFSAPRVENCLFTRQLTAGIYVHGASARITANIFVHNVSYGIWAESRKGLSIRHNLFWDNGDAHCYRCPYQVLQFNTLNARGDSVDVFGNLRADPVFIGSDSEKRLQKQDPLIPTPRQEVKDTTLYAMHRRQDSLGKAGLPPRGTFTPQGYGPWRLSQYSPALDAGPESAEYEDLNNTRCDIGLWGALKRYHQDD